MRWTRRRFVDASKRLCVGRRSEIEIDPICCFFEWHLNQMFCVDSCIQAHKVSATSPQRSSEILWTYRPLFLDFSNSIKLRVLPCFASPSPCPICALTLHLHRAKATPLSWHVEVGWREIEQLIRVPSSLSMNLREYQSFSYAT